MTHTYNISGMTCKSCVAKVKSEFLKLGDISDAEVQLDTPQATLTMQKHIPVASLQSAIGKAGSYTITEADGGMKHHTDTTEASTGLAAYKPLFLVFFYILLLTSIGLYLSGGFDWMLAMRYFMGGFFISFSFFKMLDLKGFAESYSSYDIIARKFMGWGYVYAFIELALGIAYLTNCQPVLTNAVTFIVMSLSIIGVLQSVMNKRKIQCACLGTVFNLPMSTVTIIEDGLMILMSAGMLVYMLG